MRADIQIIISEIDKSLSLLRQRLDWDNVRKKREEFDALTEDPDLWNEPDKAQSLCENGRILLIRWMLMMQ